MANHDLIITHGSGEKEFDIKKYEDRLKAREKTIFPLDQELKLLRDLAKFEFGRFLLQNKGLDGYWTSYLILKAPYKENLTELEKWLVNKAPTAVATRERFFIFRRILQNKLKSGTKIASIPCGLMDDLLGLDYNLKSDVTLVAIGLDEKSLALARENAKNYSYNNVEFYNKNAWDLGINSELDIIVSSGLNIYEPRDTRVLELYKEFFKSLKPGGILISSFLTPPPPVSENSPWKNYNKNDAALQKAVFSDIIVASWQSYRSEEQTKELLEKAGYTEIEFFYDSQNIFPSFTAKKPL